MKKIIIVLGLVLSVIVIENLLVEDTSFKYTYLKKDASEQHTVLQNPIVVKEQYLISNLGKSFIGFKEALAFKESQGDYFRVNKFGYLGKYQFNKNTLKRFNILDTKEFLNSPKLQENAFIGLCSVNKWILRRDIKRYVGKKINGILITESGILAAAHLSGAGSVKKYLRSNGAFEFNDAFGTTIPSYLKKFGGYDTSIIEANRHPIL